MRSKNIIPILLTIIIIMYNPPWMFWGGYNFIISTLTIVVIFFLLYNRILKKQNLFLNKFFILVLYVLYFLIFSSIYEFRFSSILFLMMLIILSVLTKEELLKTKEILTKVLFYIITISLIPWLINTFIGELPFYNFISYGEWKGSINEVIIKNYYFFVQAQHDFIIRFYSVFDEPGVLGTLGAFILFANKYNFKDKRNVIILIGCIFTYSLAFYSLTILGLLFRYKRQIHILISILLILVSSIFFLLKDNLTFQSQIIERFENFDNVGIDSRTSDRMNIFFNEYVSSIDFLYGKGLNIIKENNNIFTGQSYKFFFIEYGLIGFLILVLCYFSFLKQTKFSNYIILIFYLLSFLQRPNLFTPWVLLLFVITICTYNNFLYDKTTNKTIS